MASILKRKRSDSELSYSSSSTLSSPSRLAPGFDFLAITTPDCDSFVPSMLRGQRAPLHLSSRTLKRFRNGRPSDAEVHEHTLGLLYSAQQSDHREVSPPSGETPRKEICEKKDGIPFLSSSPPQHTQDHARTKQASLYSFWNIAQVAYQPPPSATSMESCQVASDVDRIVGNDEDYGMSDVNEK